MATIRIHFRLRIFTAFFAAFLSSFCAAQPQITKTEPPNWWTNYYSPIMVLLYGDSLADAAITVDYPGVKVQKTELQPDGKHAFVWLEMASDAMPGTVAMAVKTPSGTTQASLELSARQPQQGRFQGVTRDDVIYLIMPDRFANGDTSNDDPKTAPGQLDRAQDKMWHGGDLKGVTDHLPYLKDLGITAIWLTPWVQQAHTTSDYHGYHATDFYAVEDHLGTMADLKQMVAEAHRQGIKTVMDYVVNHTGPLHMWVQDPPTSTWYHGSPEHHLKPDYEFAPLVDPHATARERRGVLEGWFADKLADLNPDDPLVTQYLEDNAIWWTEMTGLDAIRLDTFPYSPRTFWSSWHKELFRTYPNLWTVGEVMDTDPCITAFFEGGRARFDGVDSGVSTVFDFPLEDAIKKVTAEGQPASVLRDMLRHDSQYLRPEGLVTLIGNHDQERYIHVKGATPETMKAAFALQLTLRGIPQIYYGDEIAMPGGNDPDDRHDFPGGWQSDPRNAFTREGRTPAEQEMFTHLQSLIKLRREHTALRDGRQWDLATGEHTYAFLRDDANEQLIVVFNGDSQAQTVRVAVEDTPLAGAKRVETVFSTGTGAVASSEVQLQVPPMTVAVYRAFR
ncbi:MAG TPA: alpha-amylase family glycosyl hydrolase [Candidatus Acidoferrales bacterium]|nr:alpha-amylase family glycosyl hydrolase [Candidatus Acidoferrales bacterium]